MSIFFAIFGTLIFIFICGMLVKDEEAERLAGSIVIYICGLFRDCSSWDNLVIFLKESISEKNIIFETNDIYWNGFFHELSFSAKKWSDGYSISVSGSRNGTTKKFFGFNLYVEDPDKYWIIRLEQGLMGCRISLKAKKLEQSLKRFLREQEFKFASFTNGKRSYF